MSTINIISGQYRNNRVVNQVFTLVKGYQTGKNANYVTVQNDGQFDHANEIVRVKVDSISDIQYLDGSAEVTPDVIAFKATEIKSVETDEQAMDRIAARFAVLDEMTRACINGDVRAMIVSGPPGVGKSYGVETQLEKASMFDKLAEKRVRFEVVKGAMTALGLYAQLYKYSDRKNILVFDDCDSVFQDDLSLNILKAALDSGKRRKICWNSDSALLRREGIPDRFDFHGSAIFITNLKFENVKSKKLQDHLEALQSRCHFLDLTVDTERDKMLRIKQVHRDADGGLFKDYDFETAQSDMILDFISENKSKMHELSLRMCLKIADLVKINPNTWKNLAASTCMKR